MKNKSWSYLLILVGLVTILTSSCKKENNDEDKPAKNSGFISAQEFIDNQYILDALNSAGITTYEGNTPPNIEGEYNTNTSSVYAASSNLYSHIGLPLSSIFKFYDQTSDGKVLISENGGAGYSTGQGSFITGYSNYFTIYIEASNSNGSTSAAIISGNKCTNGDLNLKGVTVYTSNPPSGLEVGDWWAYSPKWTNLINEITITVTTSYVNNITSSSVTAHGNITTTGNPTIGFCGFTFATFPYATLSSCDEGWSSDEMSIYGDIARTWTGLSPHTTYYVRAFMYGNGSQEYYGDDIAFTTN
jgi:hypothetical protein